MHVYIAAFGLFLSWLIPLHFLPWVSWHSEMVAFFAAILFAWVGVVRLISKERLRMVSFPVLAMPFMVLAVLALGQLVIGTITFGGDSLVLVLYMALCVMCITLGFVSVRSTAENVYTNETRKSNSALTLIAKVFLLGAFASAIVAFAQVFELWDQAPWINRMFSLRRPGGNIGQPNQLATLLLMGMASLLFLYESDKLKAASGALISFVLCAALAMTESRTGVLSFFLLTGWYLFRRRQAGFKIPLWTVVLGCCAFLGFFLGLALDF